jgi:hypothetical protein
VAIARSYVGESEKKPNRSFHIDRWNRNVRNPLGSPYCAAFVYWCLDSAGVKYPQKKSGLARGLVTKKQTFTAYDVIMGRQKVLKGDIPIWQKGTTMFGHTGFAAEDWDGTGGKTIEANTSPGTGGNQSDGDGVHIRNRRIEVYSYFRIKWFTRL